MRAAWLILAAVLAIGAPPVVAAEPPAVAAQVVDLDTVVAADAAKGFSGAVLVARHHQVLLDKAYGAVGAVPMRADTRFWIASSGKQFTSAAIARLQQQGKLDLADPISKFFPDAPADKRAITVRQLLSHSSGLGQSYVSEGAPDRATAVKRMLDEKLVDPPGLNFHYSNSNFQLAVAIVETVSGRPYRDFVRDELFRPAGLTDTGFSGDAGSAQVAPAREATPARLSASGWGGEGVYSTTHDLHRWFMALWSGRILDHAIVEQLFDPVVPIQEGRAALGWFVGSSPRRARTLFTRGNEDFGPNSLIYDYPDQGVLIIVLTHAGDADADHSWSRQVHADLQQALGL